MTKELGQLIAWIVFVVVLAVASYFTITYLISNAYSNGYAVATSEYRTKLVEANADRLLQEKELNETYKKLATAERDLEFNSVYGQPEGTLCERCRQLCPNDTSSYEGYSDFGDVQESTPDSPYANPILSLQLCSGFEGEEQIKCEAEVKGLTND